MFFALLRPFSLLNRLNTKCQVVLGGSPRKVWRTTYLAWHHFNVATQLLELDFALLCNLLMTT